MRIGRRGRKRQGKGKDRRPILKKLPAALLRSFRRATRQKNGLCEESARVNWNPKEGQQPFRPNSNGVGDCTTTWRRLLIGAVKALSPRGAFHESRIILFCDTCRDTKDWKKVS